MVKVYKKVQQEEFKNERKKRNTRRTDKMETRNKERNRAKERNRNQIIDNRETGKNLHVTVTWTVMTAQTWQELACHCHMDCYDCSDLGDVPPGSQEQLVWSTSSRTNRV
jgi:hypothetical protein